jgi:glutathione S-transferase
MAADLPAQPVALRDLRNEVLAAGMGIVWIVRRLIYSFGYMADPAERSAGYLIQLLASAILLFGALGRIVYSLAIGDL